MPFFKLRGKKPAGPAVNIGAVVAEVEQAAILLAVRPAEGELVLARFADGLRARNVAPPAAASLEVLCHDLDAEGWNRFALLAALLDGPSLRAVEVPAEAFVAVARDKKLLTLEVIRSSTLRAEELARALLVRLGLGVEGESAEASAARLERLDYERLLAQADTAKKDAEARMQEIRKLQQMQAAQRSRGKW